MIFRGELYLEHPTVTGEEIQASLVTFLKHFYSPPYLHVAVDLWLGDPVTLPAPDPVVDAVVPPPPSKLTFSEYYSAFAEMVFRATQALFSDPTNWLHTWRGGWTQIDGHFRSPNMLCPERFGLVVIIGDRAIIEAQRRLADSSSLEVTQ